MWTPGPCSSSTWEYHLLCIQTTSSTYDIHILCASTNTPIKSAYIHILCAFTNTPIKSAFIHILCAFARTPIKKSCDTYAHNSLLTVTNDRTFTAPTHTTGLSINNNTNECRNNIKTKITSVTINLMKY